MKHWYMLTVIGQDRPGIVAGLTDALYRGGANLGEASMTRLGGNFTIMLMVESALDRDTLRGLIAPFAETMALYVHLDRIAGELHRHVEPNIQVTVHGADRPGIVAQVTRALAEAGVNILDLNSDVAGTERSPIYVMVIDGHCAAGQAAVEAALAPLRTGGIEVRLTALDTLIG